MKPDFDADARDFRQRNGWPWCGECDFESGIVVLCCLACSECEKMLAVLVAHDRSTWNRALEAGAERLREYHPSRGTGGIVASESYWAGVAHVVEHGETALHALKEPE